MNVKYVQKNFTELVNKLTAAHPELLTNDAIAWNVSEDMYRGTLEISIRTIKPDEEQAK